MYEFIRSLRFLRRASYDKAIIERISEDEFSVKLLGQCNGDDFRYGFQPMTAEEVYQSLSSITLYDNSQLPNEEVGSQAQINL